QHHSRKTTNSKPSYSMKTSQITVPVLLATMLLGTASFTQVHADLFSVDAVNRTMDKYAPGYRQIIDPLFVLYKFTRMNDHQKEVARERAKAIRSNPEARKHRYVAVPVPKQEGEKKGGTQSDLTIIDTKTGEP